MNIGKLSFSEIIAAGFERRNALFAARWLFAILVSSVVFGLLSTMLAEKDLVGFSQVVSVAGSLVVAGLSIALSLGAYALAKASIAKTKKVDTAAPMKSLFWKTVGALILLALSVLVVAGIAYGLGFLVKIPFVGNSLMALLLIPAVVAFGLVSVYFIVGTKLLFALLIDKPKLSAPDAVKTIWAITSKAPEKLFFNFVLSALPIGLTALTLAILAGALATLPYLVFGWAFPLYPLLQFASQLGFYGLINYSLACSLSYITGADWYVYLLAGLGFYGVLSYALGFVVSVSAAAYYSIYLDASKK